MEIRNRQTGAVITDSEFRAMNPNTSFPMPMTVDVYKSYGYDPVLEGQQPTAQRFENVVRSGVEQDSLGNWVKKYVIQPMPQEQRDILTAQQAALVRSTRNQMLKDTDWTQVLDTPVNRDNWAAYRQSLRDISLQQNFPWDIQWPVEPT